MSLSLDFENIINRKIIEKIIDTADPEILRGIIARGEWILGEEKEIAALTWKNKRIFEIDEKTIREYMKDLLYEDIEEILPALENLRKALKG